MVSASAMRSSRGKPAGSANFGCRPPTASAKLAYLSAPEVVKIGDAWKFVPE